MPRQPARRVRTGRLLPEEVGLGLRAGVGLAVGAFDEGFEGEESEVLKNGGGVEIGAVDKLVDGGGALVEMLKDEALAVGEREGDGLRRGGRRGGVGWGEEGGFADGVGEGV